MEITIAIHATKNSFVSVFKAALFFIVFIVYTPIILLNYLDGDLLREVEAVVLVVDGDDLAVERVALLVTELAEKAAVKSPFKGEGILGEDGGFVVVVVADPLTVDLHFSARDIEDETVIIALAQRDALTPANGSRQILWREIFHEEACWIHQDQGLRLIAVESDIVSEVCRRPDHLQQLIYILNFRIHLEKDARNSNIHVVGIRR